jgi:hydrogenase maturation protein HypF
MSHGARLHITGIVQGVGFRPFVYKLAGRFGLTGWVRNTSAGVEIEVDGATESLQAFAAAIRNEAPPLARIDDFSIAFGVASGFSRFEILASKSLPEAFQPISPDVAVCEDCRREMLDRADRRFRYPFINCTNCGPRFTIVIDIPYDRPKTTMSRFQMCPDCAREYSDPGDRRFHAQPVACPICGPHVWLEFGGATSEGHSLAGEAALRESRRLLSEGKIVAVKGLGGFHLACDATNSETVSELRRRKLRVDKPFAVMLADVGAAEQQCLVDPAESALLESAARPIVLLHRRPSSFISPSVAPGQDWVGVMLPYTPLHYLLMERADSFPAALVMTSGNLSEEPIATTNDDARRRLRTLADAVLMHDRDIHVRCDDSVVRVVSDGVPSAIEGPNPQHTRTVYPLRRSRGLVPLPVKLPWEVAPLLAVGAQLKNTFCLAKGPYGFLSHHIGDLENYETLQSLEQGIVHFEKLFHVRPEAIAYDLHPDYLATRYALRRTEMDGLPALGIQHHHAHIASCMIEHGLDGSSPTIGIAFDGTGYGDDGAIWGGEFLVGDYVRCQRMQHMPYFPLPGGDLAIRQPARVALALLWSFGLDWDERLAAVAQFRPAERANLLTQLERKINAPPTSSVGRLFDAAASLAGLRQTVNYEAQAAIEFEALADPGEDGSYDFGSGGASAEVKHGFESLLADVLAGVSVATVSARFHNGIARMIVEAAVRLRVETGIEQVVLSGGVWQNITLLRRTLSLFRQAHFQVYIHRQVPANDGGLALGQAAVAAARLRVGYVPGSTGKNS